MRLQNPGNDRHPIGSCLDHVLYMIQRNSADRKDRERRQWANVFQFRQADHWIMVDLRLRRKDWTKAKIIGSARRRRSHLFRIVR